MKTSRSLHNTRSTSILASIAGLLLAIIPDQAFALGDAVDAPSLPWTTGGDVGWLAQTSITKDGVDAAINGDIGSYGLSWMETTVTGPGTVEFWWKVSSESGWDFLTFSIDNVSQPGAISGEVDWNLKTFEIPAGTHTLRWSYSKDGSASYGLDSGWVDQVVFTPAGPVNTGIATNVDETTATLNGTVNPGGLPTTAYFAYGLTTSYGSTAPVVLSPNNGTLHQSVSVNLTGLQAGQVYHYRLVAANSSNPAPGADRTFTTVSPFSYTESNGEATITGYNGSQTALVIPATIGGFPVKRIGSYAFYNRSSLTSVTIPSGVTNIDEYAFAYCSSLASVTLPGSVTTIGSNAFYSCGSLATVVFSSPGLLELGLYSFYNCDSLESFPFPNTLTTIGGGSFASCNKLQSVVIPGSVTSIGASAFSYCYALSNVSLPQGLLTIGDEAFYECGALVSLIIPNSVTSLGSYAFAYCNLLASITLPSGLTEIPQGAFFGCPKLATLNVPAVLTSIGSSAFASCASLTSMTLPASVTSIGGYAWQNCSALTSVNLPAALSSIPEGLFSGCTSLVTAPIPGAITSIGSSAFYGCAKLANVTLPNTVTSIGSNAFRDCTSLTSFTFPSAVTVVADSVLNGCSSLTSVTLHAAITSIGSSAFGYCSNLASLAIPAAVTTIGNSAFRNCNSLTSITIPPGVTTINDSTFSSCSNLTSVNLPAGITSIGSSAFAGCSKLPNLTLPAAVTSIGGYAFQGCAALASVVIPSGVTVLQESTFEECSNLTSATLPSGLTTVGSNVFRGCTKLASISIPAGVTSIGSGAFRGCSSLASILLPTGITTIQSSTFEDCTSLTSVTLPTGLLTIRYRAFADCKALSSIAIPSTVTAIEEEAFSGCSALASVSIPASCTSLGENVWIDCVNLGSILVAPSNTAFSSDAGMLFNKPKTTLLKCPEGKSGTATIPSGTTTLASSSFRNCTKLTGVTIPATVTAIGSSAFSECRGLTSMNLPASLTSLGSSAFRNCVKLATVSFGNGLTVLSSSLFEGCTSLASVTLPASLKEIWTRAFSGCSALTSLNLPSGLESIGDQAFSGCSKLAAINLPSTLLMIDTYAFRHCRALTSINIPASVEFIGSRVFAGCSNLLAIHVHADNADYASSEGILYNKSMSSLIQCPEAKSGHVAIPQGVTGIRDSSFRNCLKITSVTLPSSVNNIGSSAFRGCSGLVEIVFPPAVNEIGDHAFDGCSSLTRMDYQGSGGWIGDFAFTGASKLKAAYFHGSAPFVGEDAFPSAGQGFTVFHLDSHQNFTGFDWQGYALQGLAAIAPEIAVDGPGGLELTDNTSSVPFGNTLVGSPVNRSFTIRNLGHATLTGIAVSTLGTHASEFVVTAAPASSLEGPSGSTTFTVRFTPLGAGQRSATLRIASNDADENPFEIPVNGSATTPAPEIAVEQPAGLNLVDGSGSIPFGAIAVGPASLTKSFIIRNTGTATLTGLAITKVGTHPGDFLVGLLSKTSLAPGTNLTFTVAFKPTVAGNRAASLRIASNDANENPFDIAVTGIGLAPEIAVLQGVNLIDGKATVNFGSVKPNPTGVIKTFTIRNLGNAPLTGLAVIRGGTHATNYTVGKPGTNTLAPGASTTFDVTFKPSVVGTRIANLKIASNDKDENPFDITLTGVGLAPKAVKLHPLLAATTSGGTDSSVGRMTVDGKTYLTLTYQDPGSENGSRSAVEVSTNLVDWFSGPRHTTLVRKVRGTVTVRDNTPLVPGKQRHIRLKQRD